MMKVGVEGGGGPIVTENHYYLAFAILCASDGTGAHDACVIRLTGVCTVIVTVVVQGGTWRVLAAGTGRCEPACLPQCIIVTLTTGTAAATPRPAHPLFRHFEECV